MVECDVGSVEFVGFRAREVFGEKGVVDVDEDVHGADHVEGLERNDEKTEADFSRRHGVDGLGLVMLMGGEMPGTGLLVLMKLLTVCILDLQCKLEDLESRAEHEDYIPLFYAPSWARQPFPLPNTCCKQHNA